MIALENKVVHAGEGTLLLEVSQTLGSEAGSLDLDGRLLLDIGHLLSGLEDTGAHAESDGDGLRSSGQGGLDCRVDHSGRGSRVNNLACVEGAGQEVSKVGRLHGCGGGLVVHESALLLEDSRACLLLRL